jgi:formamidopyrimidine-DNA glycosylase
VPELPEVEILVRHLRPLLERKVIRSVEVRRRRVVRPTTPRKLSKALRHAQFTGLERRGKYLLFHLQTPAGKSFLLVGHLGMTGRMYLLAPQAKLPRHTAVVLHLDNERFVFEDTRYFGRLMLDTTAVTRLGAEPLAADFTPATLAAGLKRSAQPIKIKLLDQTVVAGVGNIYASEALFRARISPRQSARRLTREEIERLWSAIRDVLTEAVAGGSTVALNFAGVTATDRLFYFGSLPDQPSSYEERLLVYDRYGLPCARCATPIQRLVQAGRSTFYCPRCQNGRAGKRRR